MPLVSWYLGNGGNGVEAEGRGGEDVLVERHEDASERGHVDAEVGGDGDGPVALPHLLNGVQSASSDLLLVLLPALRREEAAPAIAVRRTLAKKRCSKTR